MASSLICILSAVFLLSSVTAQEQCYKNEVPNADASECVDDCCPMSDGSRNPACPSDCVSKPFVCDLNYSRTADGICVPDDECPIIECDSNEMINEDPSDCINDCCPMSVGSNPACPSDCTSKPYVCNDGYLRLENGTCVPVSECQTCGENEEIDEYHVDCPSDYCPKTECEEASECSNVDCPTPACKCRFNYRRADNGTCIPTTSCPPFDCTRPNEEYVACPAYCPTDSCADVSMNGTCPFTILIVLNCSPKCQCKKGYARNEGECVPVQKCHSQECGPNEVPNETDDNCIDDWCSCGPGEESACTSDCLRKPCICAPNYQRATNGTCIPTKDCPNAKDGGNIFLNASYILLKYLFKCFNVKNI